MLKIFFLSPMYPAARHTGGVGGLYVRSVIRVSKYTDEAQAAVIWLKSYVGCYFQYNCMYDGMVNVFNRQA